MTKTVKITKEFITYRNKQAKECLKNEARNHGRTLRQIKQDMDCLLHEWLMIEETGHEPEDYTYDYLNALKGHVDVKFIKSNSYSFPSNKIGWKLKQLGTVDHLEFCRWISKPSRALQTGDTVTYEVIDTVKFSEVLSQLTEGNNYFHYQVVKPKATEVAPGVLLTMTVDRVERHYVEYSKFVSRRVYGDLECPGKMGLWMISEKQFDLLKSGMKIEFTCRETDQGYYWIDTFKQI